ncbi:MAG: DUF1570 domain-containing protein [Planctomycetia bacterium]|nr:DUF1570 domain-containing protein [Planctomycetia bacterium]
MRLALVGAAAALLAAAVALGGAPGLAYPRVASAAEERSAEGPTCRVVGHDVSEPGVAACRDALEAAAPLLADLLPWRVPAGTRLVVHVYGDLDAYAAAMRAAGAPELADNWAATLYASRESHVVLQPRGGPAIRALTGGLPEYTRWQLVHEAVHQVLARSGVPTYDLWPGWLEEGLCEEVAARAVAARQPAGRVAVADADRRHLVKDALARGRLVGLERLLHTRVQAFDPERLAYAHMASFVRFLATDAARFRALLAKATAMPAPPPGVRARRQVVFERDFARLLVDVFGPLDALEARWRAAIEREAPRWFEPSRSSQWLPDGRLLVASFPGGSAQCIATAPPPAGGYVLEGTFRLLAAGDGAQADLIVAYAQRDDARFVKLALGAKGYVTMLAYAAGHWQERYRVSVEVPPATFAVGTDVAFALTVADGRLRLAVGGRTLFDAEAPPGFDLATGGYGVGAWDGAAVFDEPRATPRR